MKDINIPWQGSLALPVPLKNSVERQQEALT